ncbi:MAG: helix-turn-helix transcriptional regulator [Paludibacteraceae bacterium]|nr:helix-turn-helix transcriptional regulator [Paludibacteraceae bacterium]
MQTNNHQIKDYSAALEKKYGAVGTKTREQFDEEAWDFYTGQVLLDARKRSKITQEELARRINSNKSYISRIERGLVTPSVGVFYRIVNALGFRVDLVYNNA